jgi:hypothetical protein
VNRIEFDDADSMWQEFQVRLEHEKPKATKGFWQWIKILPIFLLIALGGFLVGNSFNQRKMVEVKSDTEVTTTKEQSFLLPSSDLTQEPPLHNPIHANNSDRFIQAENGINHNIEKDEGINPGITKWTETNSAKMNSGHLKSGVVEKRNNLIPNEDKAVKPNSNLIDSNQILENPETENFGQDGFEESIGQGHSIAAVKLVEPINKIEIKELSLINSEKSLHLVAQTDEWKASKPESWFLSIENSFARNGIRNHALGWGKYYYLNSHSGIKVQAGGSLDIGYSFSQDSIFILNGLSIEEIRKDKDLKHIWNGYLDVGYYHRKNRWQFGLGLRGSYALFNQFYFVESTIVSSLGTFNTGGGEWNQREEKGSWSGINRMSVDAYLNINYQLFANYSVGVFAGKRLNKLIKSDMANQAHSNIPVKFGVVLNKYF